MLLQIFTVYDSKVGAYLTPFFMRSEGEAIRAFSQVVNEKETNFSKYPEDYTLFHLGSFDDATGVFDLLSTTVPLIKALSLIK